MDLQPLEQFDFHHRIEETPGPALVVFTGPACGACRALKQALAVQGGELDGIIVFEVDAQRDMGLVREFEVFHLPAMFLFQDGRYHCQLHAEARPRALADAIATALAAPPEELP